MLGDSKYLMKQKKNKKVIADNDPAMIKWGEDIYELTHLEIEKQQRARARAAALAYIRTIPG